MNELASVDKSQPVALSESATILQIIGRAASDPSTDIDKMERLLAMHERMKAQQAEQAFNDAMSDAQAEMRPISADCTNPQTRSKYASYAQLDKALRPIYTRHGFALSFNTGDAAEGWVKVLCYVSHKGGYTRTYQQTMPSDGKGAKGNDVMTKTHASGAAMSYGSRYALKGIFNVAIGEDDSDGNEPADAPPLFDIEAWADAIRDCSTSDELTKVSAELSKARVPKAAMDVLGPLGKKKRAELEKDSEAAKGAEMAK